MGMKPNWLNSTVKYINNDSNLMGLFCYNQFSEDIEYAQSPVWDNTVKPGSAIHDGDLTDLKYYLSNIHNFEPSKQVLGEACYIVSKRKSYHPVKKYIESIKWDGIKRLDDWLVKSIKCQDNIYTRQVSSKFLIAAVNRIYNPGCKFDHMLILEGRQGIGKSTLVEMLAGEWYLDTNFDNHDKDLIDSMRGIFIVEISELSGMDKKDVDWLKSFLSKKVDRVRLPYAQRSKDFRRKCVFIGTYNPSGNNMYLRDDTGNRRFWPVECLGDINFDYVKENKGQLWAEAFARYKNNEKYFIDDKEALKILSEIHAERELESPTQIMIKDWLRGKNEVVMADIIQDCLKINMSGKAPKELLGIQTTVGIIMKKLCWKKGNNENRDRYYSPEPMVWDE